MDFGFGPSFEEFCQTTGVAPDWCRIFFSQRLGDTSLTPWDRCSYCPYCLQDDVVAFGFPCWRKEWCSFCVSHCQVHKCLLQSVDFSHFNERAWEAFVFSLSNRGAVYWPGTAGRFLNILALRVQRFLSLKSMGSHDRDLCSVADFLLMSFLSLGTDTRGCGYARLLFKHTIWSRMTRENYSYDDCMDLGARSANPVERMSALLLLGVVFEVFNERELDFLSEYVIRHGGIFPKNAKSAGYEMPNFFNLSEKALYVEKLRAKSKKCSPSIIASIEAFISGIRTDRTSA